MATKRSPKYEWSLKKGSGFGMETKCTCAGRVQALLHLLSHSAAVTAVTVYCMSLKFERVSIVRTLQLPLVYHQAPAHEHIHKLSQFPSFAKQGC